MSNGIEGLLQVAQLSKFREGGGLGISLEGTVDVENGQEVRPHHYIRSVLNDGPVGTNGRLRSGDELLEVGFTNQYKLNNASSDFSGEQSCQNPDNFRRYLTNLLRQYA